MPFLVMMMFVLMITFTGIAVDVARFETRRVALQQTLDRAVLAAANLNQTLKPEDVVKDYFEKANLQEDLAMVDFEDPVVTGAKGAGMTGVTATARVTSKNFFMGFFSGNDFLSGPASAKAEQGQSSIEVMLVLDVTGSMGGSAGNGKTKLQALKEAANAFVDIVKTNDANNVISVGIVPFAAQVSVSEDLRKQFKVTNLATWDGVPNVGIPGRNCLEFPVSSYSTTGVSLTTPIPMSAVGALSKGSLYIDIGSTTTAYDPPQPAPMPFGNINIWGTACEASTSFSSGFFNGKWTVTPFGPTRNLVALPTKNGDAIKKGIDALQLSGNTYTVLGMRWGTALLDQAARPIYANLLPASADMAGRPADNDSPTTRKIIILMTDGEHTSSDYILGPYKSGASPIWRGTDGKFAIRFVNPVGLPKKPPPPPIRPGSVKVDTETAVSCSGWQLADYDSREYFVPHLKRNSVKQNSGEDPEGEGTGASVSNACDPQAWLATPAWAGSGVVTQLDWSEVWRMSSVEWVVRQLYLRSDVTGFTDFNTVRGGIVKTYLDKETNMDKLLLTNCTAARNAGMEVYGIAFQAPEQGQKVIQGCSSLPKDTNYFNATGGGDIVQVFKKIASDISDLRLTQ